VEASALQAPAGVGRHSARGRLLRLRSDDQLVALFRMGHDEAFGAIHDRYRQRLFAYTRQMLAASRSDAEDALQDVFIRAYSALRADDRPVTLRAWLYRVAHNRCIDQLRRPALVPAELIEAARAPLHDPLAECERREDLRRLVADVRRLPAPQRSALLMRELEGLSYREISEALLVTVPAVKSLLVRARVGLAEAIEARDAACTEIRADLAGSVERGVRASSRARRHMRDCSACRDYRAGLRRARNGLASLSPGGGLLSSLAKLLGLGAGGSGAAAGGGVAIGGGAATVTATKVAALVCCAALAGGAAEVQQIASTAAPKHHAKAHAPAAPRAPTANITPHAVPVPATEVEAAVARPAAERPHTTRKAATRGAADRSATQAPGTPANPADPPLTIDPKTGGALAPDEPAPADGSAGAPAGGGTNPDAPPSDATAPAPAGAASSSGDEPATTGAASSSGDEPATTGAAPVTGISPSSSTTTSPPSSTSKY
jgi:RNA polymerase sigma factor (sigma-70 family)